MCGSMINKLLLRGMTYKLFEKWFSNFDYLYSVQTLSLKKSHNILVMITWLMANYDMNNYI